MDANGAGVGNSLNAWLGAQANDITVSGADGAWNTQWMELWPEIRFNPAVRVRGMYWIGGFQTYNGGAAGFSGTGSTGAVLGTNTDLGSSYYLRINRQAQPSPGRISLGQWDQLWVTAQTPWGILAFGKRPSQFGMYLIP